ncbi:MAG: iron-regulated protein [Chitinophagaceae bacterium]|nr:MAG: iron-regulated protein [Chitinophagaceae bacterium]
MRKSLLSLLLVVFASLAFAQHKPAYVLYNAKGKKWSYKKMVRDLKEKDIILFGEYHNNPIAHWLQLELTKDMAAKRKLTLGGEMFEQDNQLALNAYLQGKLSAKGLDSSARLWNNYKTDYAPLVNFAKENGFSFLATNVPRRYASMVSRAGFAVLDTLSAKEKQWMAPLPIAYDSTLPGYKKMLEMMPGHNNAANFPKAQALKDATMAHFILQNFAAGTQFIHYNGSYHSDNYEGILWYLKLKQPNLKYATITTVSQKDIGSLLAENKRKADYIICVDEDMTSTY